MRKPPFCLYKCENEVADQMRGTYNCVADRRLFLRYRDNTSVSDPKTVFFATWLIFNYNDKQPFQEGLSACIQCVGIGKLGWVKAIHRLKCNHAGCFYFHLYEYYAFLAFICMECKCFNPHPAIEIPLTHITRSDKGSL